MLTTENAPAVMSGFDVPPRHDLILSVVIPVYNERETLPRIVRAVMLALPEVTKEIVVVDDGSKDGTRQWLIDMFPSSEESVRAVSRSPQGVIEFHFSEEIPNQSAGLIEVLA